MRKLSPTSTPRQVPISYHRCPVTLGITEAATMIAITGIQVALAVAPFPSNESRQQRRSPVSGQSPVASDFLSRRNGTPTLVQYRLQNTRHAANDSSLTDRGRPDRCSGDGFRTTVDAAAILSVPASPRSPRSLEAATPVRRDPSRYRSCFVHPRASSVR